MGRKEGRGAAAPLSRELEPRLVAWAEVYLIPYQAASSSIQPFGRNRHGPKLGGGCLFSAGSWIPIKQKVACAEAYRDIKWHLSPSSRLATTDIGRKLGAVPLGEGSWIPI